MSNRTKIDCAVLSYNQKKYLLPMNALAEIISVEKGISFLSDPNDPKIRVHRITWHEFEIPLFTFNFDIFKIKGVQFEKIVIVRAIFSKNCEFPPFFGLYINDKIWRKTLSPETIKWIDEKQKSAQIIDKNSTLEITIFDLFSFSHEVENNILKNG